MSHDITLTGPKLMQLDLVQEHRAPGSPLPSTPSGETGAPQKSVPTLEPSPPSRVGDGSSHRRQTNAVRTQVMLEQSSTPKKREREVYDGKSAKKNDSTSNKRQKVTDNAPHPKDFGLPTDGRNSGMVGPHGGRYFHVRLSGSSSPVVAEFAGRRDGDSFEFHHHGKKIWVPKKDIDGYRPIVGQRHPPGKIRPVEDRLKEKSLVLLSVGDGSEPLARQRQEPGLAPIMGATTFEATPNYESYPPNKEALDRLGIPVVPSVDLSKTESVQEKLKHLPPGSQVHFQMPRVPRGTSGYSTQRLVRDTLQLPQTLDRPLGMSITTPDPGVYAKPKVHNQIYGIENGSALKDTGLQVTSHKKDEALEEYGYTHRQTTTDKSTGAAETRREYQFGPAPKDEGKD